MRATANSKIVFLATILVCVAGIYGCIKKKEGQNSTPVKTISTPEYWHRSHNGIAQADTVFTLSEINDTVSFFGLPCGRISSDSSEQVFEYFLTGPEPYEAAFFEYCYIYYFIPQDSIFITHTFTVDGGIMGQEPPGYDDTLWTY